MWKIFLFGSPFALVGLFFGYGLCCILREKVVIKKVRAAEGQDRGPNADKEYVIVVGGKTKVMFTNEQWKVAEDRFPTVQIEN